MERRPCYKDCITIQAKYLMIYCIWNEGQRWSNRRRIENHCICRNRHRTQVLMGRRKKCLDVLFFPQAKLGWETWGKSLAIYSWAAVRRTKTRLHEGWSLHKDTAHCNVPFQKQQFYVTFQKNWRTEQETAPHCCNTLLSFYAFFDSAYMLLGYTGSMFLF